jgi:hypothetical protein
VTGIVLVAAHYPRSRDGAGEGAERIRFYKLPKSHHAKAKRTLQEFRVA